MCSRCVVCNALCVLRYVCLCREDVLEALVATSPRHLHPDAANAGGGGGGSGEKAPASLGHEGHVGKAVGGSGHRAVKAKHEEASGKEKEGLSVDERKKQQDQLNEFRREQVRTQHRAVAARAERSFVSRSCGVV